MGQGPWPLTGLEALLDPSLFRGCLLQSCLLWPLPAPTPRPACTSLAASVISLLCSPPWARLCLGATGRLPMCTVEAATPTAADKASRLYGSPRFQQPCSCLAPGSKRFRAQNNQARPRTAHPHPTHCLLRVSIQRESSSGKNNSQAPTEHREMGLVQGCHKPWHIDPLQSREMSTGSSHVLQLRKARLCKGSDVPQGK